MDFDVDDFGAVVVAPQPASEASRIPIKASDDNGIPTRTLHLTSRVDGAQDSVRAVIWNYASAGWVAWHCVATAASL